MSLTDLKLRSLKGRGAPYKISDGEGLHVLVSKSGARLWRFAYRFAGKQKLLALGKYPYVTLSDARRARDSAKSLLSKGVDPSVSKKAEKRAAEKASRNTFGAVANEWFALNETRWAESYSSRLKSRLDSDLIPVLGQRPIAEIEPIEVLEAIRKIEGRGAIEMAKRVMQMSSEIFRYGVATARCRRDPSADVRGALKPSPPPKHRTALSATDLPEFMDALEKYEGNLVTALAMRLMVLTFVRTTELRFARWSEFEELDGVEPLWRIPAERMKMRRAHLVPLAPQTVRTLRQLRKKTGNGDHLFPAMHGEGVMSVNTLIYALYRMGYHSRATVHGFRSTASTILNEQQFNRDWIEMQLAHFDGSVRGIYNAAEWLPGRRKMMCWWADHVSGNSKIKFAA